MTSVNYFLAWWNLETLYDVENLPGRNPDIQTVVNKSFQGWNDLVLDKKLSQLSSIMIPLAVIAFVFIMTYLITFGILNRKQVKIVKKLTDKKSGEYIGKVKGHYKISTKEIVTLVGSAFILLLFLLNTTAFDIGII